MCVRVTARAGTSGSRSRSMRRKKNKIVQKNTCLFLICLFVFPKSVFPIFLHFFRFTSLLSFCHVTLVCLFKV